MFTLKFDINIFMDITPLQLYHRYPAEYNTSFISNNMASGSLQLENCPILYNHVATSVSI